MPCKKNGLLSLLYALLSRISCINSYSSNTHRGFVEFEEIFRTTVSGCRLKGQKLFKTSDQRKLPFYQWLKARIYQCCSTKKWKSLIGWIFGTSKQEQYCPWPVAVGFQKIIVIKLLLLLFLPYYDVFIDIHNQT